MFFKEKISKCVMTWKDRIMITNFQDVKFNILLFCFVFEDTGSCYTCQDSFKLVAIPFPPPSGITGVHHTSSDILLFKTKKFQDVKYIKNLTHH